MIDTAFVAVLSLAIASLLFWGIRVLPAERWQMIASVPVAKQPNGEWKGMNLTYYGFFSATASTFGIAIAIVLLSAIHVSMTLVLILVVGAISLCLPASRIIAGLVERKSSTFTIAGAAFVGALVLPPVLWAGDIVVQRWNMSVHPLPALAAIAISYALSEAIGRLACLSFGCCYGKPLRHSSRTLAYAFHRFHTVFYGCTKKVAYASGLEQEPLIPVQAMTSIIFALCGLVGLCLFLGQYWRGALLTPALGTWGWRAIAENLRADHRGHTRISSYQVMSIAAIAYVIAVAYLLPDSGPAPDLGFGLSQVSTLTVMLALQSVWVLLFLFYGRSRVTESLVSFHVVSERT
jgi:prolipoprotein diacylglyceryltransferase